MAVFDTVSQMARKRTFVGNSPITGVQRLMSKESDRASTLLTELSVLGARIEMDGNTTEITGGTLTG